VTTRLVSIFLIGFVLLFLILWLDLGNKLKGAMPSYANQEFLDQRYADFLGEVRTAAEASADIASFQQAIDDLRIHRDVLYIGAVTADGETHHLFHPITWKRMGMRIQGEVGTGVLTNQKERRLATVIQRIRPNAPHLDNYTIHFFYERASDPESIEETDEVKLNFSVE